MTTMWQENRLEQKQDCTTYFIACIGKYFRGVLIKIGALFSTGFFNKSFAEEFYLHEALVYSAGGNVIEANSLFDVKCLTVRACITKSISIS